MAEARRKVAEQRKQMETAAPSSSAAHDDAAPALPHATPLSITTDGEAPSGAMRVPEAGVKDLMDSRLAMQAMRLQQQQAQAESQQQQD